MEQLSNEGCWIIIKSGGRVLVQSNITIIVIFVIYLAMMLAIGLIAYKKTSNTEDYFLGGRQ